MIIVLDASSAVNIVHRNPIRDRLLPSVVGCDVLAPSLIDSEVASALARMERAGELSAPEAATATRLWAQYPVQQIADSALFLGAWELRHAMRVTDAFYVSLARRLTCPLVTCDARLARTPNLGIPVTLIT